MRSWWALIFVLCFLSSNVKLAEKAIYD